jgi:predicted RNA-binding Zn-ribbon protein involved in translation (DUF1610 family)
VPVAICDSCGERVTLRSQFELAGPCPECGEETLVEEDAYDQEPEELTCTDCGYRVRGGGSRSDANDRPEGYAGRLTVDDPCPRCEGVLDPDGWRKSRANPPDYKIAKAVAARVLRDHELGLLPVNVIEIAEKEGLKVVFGAFAHQGQLVGGDTLEVPVSEPTVAQRFLIAHEIAHRHLRHKVSDDNIEPEANAFASELLVPRPALAKSVGEGLTLAELRQRFDVSREVIVYALSDAKLLDKVKLAR